MATNHKIRITAKDKTRNAFGSVKKGLGGIKKNLFNVKTALAGVVGAAGFGALVKSSLASVDALAKTSDKLGITTQALAGLQHAAELSGVSTNTLNMALQRMTRRVSEAAMGTGEAKAAIKELGLDAEKLAAQSPDETMKDLADAMQGVTNQADRVRLSMKLFDSEGVALVNTLSGGAAALREAEQEAKQLGVTVSRFDAAKIEQANDAWTKSKKAIEGIANKISIALSPYLTAINTQFFEAAKSSNGFANTTSSGLDKVKSAIYFVADSLQYLKQAWQLVKLGAVGALDGVISSIAWVDQSLSNLLDKIPGMEFKPSADLQLWAAASKLAVDDVAGGLEKLLMEPMPSEGLEETFTKIETLAATHATKIVAINEKKNSKINQANGQWNKKENKTDKFYTKLKDKTIVGGMIQMTQGVAQQSRAMFEINKVSATANALIDTKAAVTGAYKWGASIGGPYAGAAAGALAFGAQMAQVSAIQSTTFGGGGGGTTPSAAGSSPVVNDTPIETDQGGQASAPGQNFTLNVDDDDLMTGAAVKKLMKKIGEQMDNGVTFA